MDDDLRDAIALLQRKRAAHLAQVERIDAAVAALAAVIQEPEEREAGQPQDITAADDPPARHGFARAVLATVGDLATAQRQQVQSTRQKVVSLAEEADRHWSVGQMIAEYRRRGAPFSGANPDSAVRAAIVTAVDKGQLYRTAYGRYRATKFREAPEPSFALINGIPADRLPEDDIEEARAE